MDEPLPAAVDFIRRHTALRPRVALVLGSGLGALAAELDGPALPFTSIPGFPAATAPGHAGALRIGRLFGRDCVVLQGRVHLYEGYSPQQVVFPVRVMAALGAQALVLTNAAGALNPAYAVGDLVAIEDHLSLPVAAGLDPLRGPNDPAAGPRFVSMNQAYDPALRTLAQRLGGGLARGVYAHVAGPSFEPPALIRLLRLAGCDLVGMSTVPEVIAARHAGLRVCAVSAVTNIAVATVDDTHVTSEQEVWDAVALLQPRLRALMQALVPAVADEVAAAGDGGHGA